LSSRSRKTKTRKSKPRPRSGVAAPRAPLPRRQPEAAGDFFDLDFATVWRRIWGYVIDVALLGAISFADFQIVTHWLGTGNLVRIVLLVLQILVVVSYGAILIGWRGATVGMNAAKLIAVDRVSCRILHWRRSWGRAVIAFALTGMALDIISVSGFKTSQAGIDGSIAAGAFLLTLAGYGTFFYWAKWDPLHQTLQDKVGHSIVLRTVARESERWSWRKAASGLGRQYVGSNTTPVGRKRM
jgi:RDD family